LLPPINEKQNEKNLNKVLVITKNDLERISGHLNRQRNEDEANLDEIKRRKELLEKSKALTQNWNNTIQGSRRHKLEQKKIREDKLEQERLQYLEEIKELHKKNYEILSNVDQSDLKEKFNELFNSNADIPIDKQKLEVSVFNGCNDLSIYTTLNDLSYNSMYSNSSLYEELFKVEQKIHYDENNKTLQEKMNEYNTKTKELERIAKISNNKNTFPACL
jgi:hypothetical protein